MYIGYTNVNYKLLDAYGRISKLKLYDHVTKDRNAIM